MLIYYVLCEVVSNVCLIFAGDILNDCDSGIDYLGHTVYAEALAEKIDRVTPPLTIGVFGRWGSGKSFLLKYVKSKLTQL